MKFLNKWGMALIPALALATPAFAVVAIPDQLSNNSELPGSVIVFPKFVKGLVNVDGNTFSRTEIELGAVCPAGLVCPENTKVKVRLHWVCPGAEGANSNICSETNFEILTLTGWAPHPDQQRPLRPGSAKARLADALGAVERPAGEKAGG